MKGSLERLVIEYYTALSKYSNTTGSAGRIRTVWQTYLSDALLSTWKENGLDILRLTN